MSSPSSTNHANEFSTGRILTRKPLRPPLQWGSKGSHFVRKATLRDLGLPIKDGNCVMTSFLSAAALPRRKGYGFLNTGFGTLPDVR